MRHSGSRSRQRARFDPPSGARARWTPAAAAFAATIFVAAPARSSEAEIAAPPWADPQVHSCALEGSTAHQRLEFVACARSLIPLVHDSERIPKPDEEHRRWRAASVATLGTLAYDLAQEPKSRRVNAGLLVSIAEIASYDLSSWDAEHSAEACTLARQALKCACDLLIHEEVTTMTPESGDLERAAIRVGRECGLRSECRITAEPPSREALAAAWHARASHS